MVAEPLHAEAADTADDEVSTFDGGLHFLNLMETDTGGEILCEFGVAVGFSAGIDDFAVQVRTHKAYFVTVFSCRKCQRRAHHAGTDNCYNSHFCASPFM